MRDKRAHPLNIVIVLMVLGAAFLGVKLWRAHSAEEHAKTGGKLISAVQSGDLRYIQSLLDQGADPHATDSTGATPLMWAAGHGHVDCMRLLIKSGAEINAKDNYGATALMEAAASGSADGVRLLLDKGATIGDTDKTGKSARAWAKQGGQADILEMLDEEMAVRKLVHKRAAHKYAMVDSESQKASGSAEEFPTPLLNNRAVPTKRIIRAPVHGAARVTGKKKAHRRHPREAAVARKETAPVSSPAAPPPPPIAAQRPSPAAPTTLPTRPPAPWEHP